MTSRFTELAIDSADPESLARFWAAALDYGVVGSENDLVCIGPLARPAGDDAGPVPPVLTFVHVPETKSVKNRLHLDLRPDGDQQAEVERLLGLGAQRVDVGQTGQESWVVLADPEGNEFCVLGSRHS